MDDLISRKAAIALCDWYEHEYSEVESYFQKFNEELKELPPAQPERKEGKWVPVVNGRGGHECNQCHEYAPSYQAGEEHLSDFCPRCGVKMKGAI